jgi:hypothetical protein
MMSGCCTGVSDSWIDVDDSNVTEEYSFTEESMKLQSLTFTNQGIVWCVAG